jgi:hypothetical protein
MKTDIRQMVEGLRPVAEFESNVERTIEALNQAADNAADDDNVGGRADLEDLATYWDRLLKGMRDD